MNPSVKEPHAGTSSSIGLGNIISVTVHNSFESTEEICPKICCICLQSFSKLISIELYCLRTAYEQLTGVSVEHDDGLPRELCVQCATLLDKYYKFRDKSIQADRYLRTLEVNGFPSQKKYVNLLENINQNKLRCSKINHIDIPPKDKPEIKLENNQTPLVVEDNIINKFKIELLPEINALSHSDIENDPLDMPVHSDSSDEPLSSLVVSKKKTKENIMNQRKKVLRNKIAAKRKIKKDLLEDKKEGIKIKPKEILEEYFRVKILSKEEQLKVIEDRREKYKHKAYTCNFCFKSFTNNTTLQLHLSEHNESRGSHICDICHIRYGSVKKLLTHHDNVHKYQYDCLNCDIVFSSRNSAVLHAKWHKGKRYTCKDCGIVLERFSSYLTHKRIKHPSDHICGYCGYSFLGDKGLNKHIASRHYSEIKTQISGPYCDACKVQFATDSALETHKGIKHTNTNRNVQIHNAKRNRNTINIKSTPIARVVWKAVKRNQRRMESDKSKQSIPCEICNIELNSRQSYRVHMNRSHPNESRTSYPTPHSTGADNMCDQCGKGYKFKSLLTEHLKTHSATPLYKCTVCPKSFYTKKQQQAHMFVHSQAEFVCPVCGKAFKHKSNRNRHYNYVHSSEKPYKCAYCDKSFKSNEQLKFHTRHLHLQLPWPKRRNKQSVDNTVLEQNIVSVPQKSNDFDSFG